MHGGIYAELIYSAKYIYYY